MLSDVLQGLQQWISVVIETIGYPGIIVIMVAENVFPPIPSELVMPFAGFLVAQGRFNLALTILAGTLGSVLGALLLYAIGMWAGEPLVRPFVRRHGRWFLLTEADLDRALQAFRDHGDMIVLGGRLVPILRSLISLPAGMNRMPIERFLLFTTLGSLAWTSALTVGGMVLGIAWEQVMAFVEIYQHIVLAAIVGGLVVFVVTRLRAIARRRGRSAQSS